MKFLLPLLIIVLFGCENKEDTQDQITAIEYHHIGTQSFKWVDSSRIDPYYGGYRLVNTQIWYPSDSSELFISYTPSQYYYEIEHAYKELSNWTDEDFQFVSKIQVNSRLNSPLSGTRTQFPVILFSPSLGGNISQYTFYAEHLAKSGFVVVGVNHLYESEYVLDNEMKVFPANLTFHDSLKTLDIPLQISAENYRAAKGDRQRVLGRDLIFCLDKIEALNQSHFNSKLDLQNIGAWGHSIGGAASIYAALLDKRFKAILDIDGTPPSTALETGIDVPFMFIEDLTDYLNHSGYAKMHQRRHSFCQLNSSDSYRILLGGTNHNSFTDINYHIAQTKSEKNKALTVLNNTESYMNHFFCRYLKGNELSLHDIKTDTLEVTAYLPK